MPHSRSKVKSEVKSEVDDDDDDEFVDNNVIEVSSRFYFNLLFMSHFCV
jgi:hypothetical protein